MKYFARSSISYSIILFIAGAMLCSLCSKAQQTDPTHKFLYITTVPDEPDRSTTNEGSDSLRSNIHRQRFYTYMFADLGTSVLNSTVNGSLNVANGMSVAFCGQVAYKLNTLNKDNQLFLSAGLELRNFNCSFTNINGVLTKDNLHFWYAGIPVMFQLVNTKHTFDNTNDINYYLQAGCTVGVQVFMSQSGDEGEETAIDQKQNYNALLLQPFLSAGISYTTKRKICLIGPYMTYNINNINNQNGVSENIYSYGIRFTELLFK